MTRRGHPEAEIQRAIVEALRLVLPPDAIVHHSANEIAAGGQAPRRLQAIRRGMGVYPGFADLIVLCEARVLLLEVKSARGHLSPAQRAFAARCAAQRIPCEMVRSVDDALAALAHHDFPIRIAGGSRCPA